MKEVNRLKAAWKDWTSLPPRARRHLGVVPNDDGILAESGTRWPLAQRWVRPLVWANLLLVFMTLGLLGSTAVFVILRPSPLPVLQRADGTLVCPSEMGRVVNGHVIPSPSANARCQAIIAARGQE